MDGKGVYQDLLAGRAVSLDFKCSVDYFSASLSCFVPGFRLYRWASFGPQMEDGLWIQRGSSPSRQYR